MSNSIGDVVHSARSAFRRVMEDGPGGYDGASQRAATDGHEGVAYGPQVALATLFRRALRPRVDVWESATAFTVVIDLPGITRESVRVMAGSDEIVIAGERRVQPPRDARVRTAERRAGRFERVVRLGPGARPESANVRLEAGVLEVRVPTGPGSSEPLKIELPSN